MMNTRRSGVIVNCGSKLNEKCLPGLRVGQGRGPRLLGENVLRVLAEISTRAGAALPLGGGPELELAGAARSVSDPHLGLVPAWGRGRLGRKQSLSGTPTKAGQTLKPVACESAPSVDIPPLSGCLGL